MQRVYAITLMIKTTTKIKTSGILLLIIKNKIKILTQKNKQTIIIMFTPNNTNKLVSNMQF